MDKQEISKQNVANALRYINKNGVPDGRKNKPTSKQKAHCLVEGGKLYPVKYVYDVAAAFAKTKSGSIKPTDIKQHPGITSSDADRILRKFGFTVGQPEASSRGERSNHSESRNLIFFGAPGTGKSFKLNEQVKTDFTSKDKAGAITSERYERVTFYPTYSYAQFVGCYKPVMHGTDISYEFVPGPFLRVLVNALKALTRPSPFAKMTWKQLLDAARAAELTVSKPKVYGGKTRRPWKNKPELIGMLDEHNQRHCLVIEEINRANAAAVFGDVFQLLDRATEDSKDTRVKKDDASEYDIAASEDIRKYLAKEIGNADASKTVRDFLAVKPDGDGNWMECRLRIPANMYIWATMNSADQGVFPLDTAFKRRWEFEYIGIDEAVTDKVKKWTIGTTNGPNWNALRMVVNGLLSSSGVNEDKLMGPWFVKPENGSVVSEEQFKSKVLMYLWEDAARMCRKKIFEDAETFGGLVKEWDTNQLKIFNKGSVENLKFEIDEEFKAPVEKIKAAINA